MTNFFLNQFNHLSGGKKNNFKFSPQSLQELSYEARGIAENYNLIEIRINN